MTPQLELAELARLQLTLVIDICPVHVEVNLTKLTGRLRDAQMAVHLAARHAQREGLFVAFVTHDEDGTGGFSEKEVDGLWFTERLGRSSMARDLREGWQVPETPHYRKPSDG